MTKRKCLKYKILDGTNAICGGRSYSAMCAIFATTRYNSTAESTKWYAAIVGMLSSFLFSHAFFWSL